MDINNFTSLPHNVLDDLYEEPEKLEVYSFEDFMNLPLNDLYLEKNGEYNPKEDLKPERFSLEKPTSRKNSIEFLHDEPTYEGFYTQSIKTAKKKNNKPREYFNEPSLGINLNTSLPNQPSASR